MFDVIVGGAGHGLQRSGTRLSVNNVLMRAVEEFVTHLLERVSCTKDNVKKQSSKVTSVLLSILTESSSDNKKQRDKLELDSESEDVEPLKFILFSGLIGLIITGLSSSWVTSQFVPLDVHKEKIQLFLIEVLIVLAVGFLL
ncbi:hypothetical protein QTP88_002373 [Uroleucon formosanum]